MGNGTRASIEPKDPNVKAQRALLSIAAAVVAATLLHADADRRLHAHQPAVSRVMPHWPISG